MISASELFETLHSHGVTFFAGVPDSLLKDFCAYVSDHTDDTQHIIAANEGNAVALAAGHYLGSGRPALVYMQNSGIGNAINPLVSLNDPEVYAIPALLVIGWRGEPGVKDEPQHIKQGRITPALLEALGIPWQVLDAQCRDIPSVIGRSMQQMRAIQGPAALLVRRGTFEPYTLRKVQNGGYPLTREAAIQRLAALVPQEDLMVATTGMIARELYEYRTRAGDGLTRDFLTVGSMGHAASIALGLARSRSDERVVCLDGDGAALMHMGGLAIIGQSRQRNLLHIILNNGAHDSVGGQPTCAFAIDIVEIARACGYAHVKRVNADEELSDAIYELLSTSGPSLLEIRVSKGSRPDLGRPKSSPIENRATLMQQLGVIQP